jgi:glycosyltransferase involved in cell wall biosynthesis
MLQAFSIVAAKEQFCRLVIAGSGILADQLSDLAARLGISRRVHFLGCRSDVKELLQGADAYVLSSAWEGTPIALLEAAAAGLPAVTTEVGGNPEVIDNGKTGFLVPPHDSHALSAAMLRMTSLGEDLRRQMGEDARIRVERMYGLGKVLARWENIYEQLLQSRADARHRSAWHLPALGRRHP